MEDILEVLDSAEADETDISCRLRTGASALINTNTKPSQLPTLLEDLLIQSIKPLFTKSHNPAITSTGRKNLVATHDVPDRFGDDSIFDSPPPWKNGWTVPLLQWTITSHNSVPELNRKKTIEAHFHLLVPPLLHMIDDAQITWKSQGCGCLQSLCNVLIEVKSTIFRRTGLTEVFIDALKNCFHYLPSLTPEDESLTLMKALYPAYLTLVGARFIMLELTIQPSTIAANETISHANNGNDKDNEEEIITIISARTTSHPSKLKPKSNLTTTTATTPTLTPTQTSTETTLRQNYLTTLLRHSLLYSLSHLSTSPSSTNNTPISSSSLSPTLTTYFLTRLSEIIPKLQIAANIHLQTLVPLLTGIMLDPFVTSAPEMLDATVTGVECLVQTCWVRVREGWWVDLLRGLVGAWLGIWDDLDLEGGGGRGVDGNSRGVVGNSREEELRVVMERMKRVVVLLADVVGREEFEGTMQKLIEEEEDVEGLFELITK